MSASHDSTPPADQRSQQRLDETGLDYRLIDGASDTDLDLFLRADSRGFLDDAPTDAVLAQMRTTMRHRRNIGVFDATAGSWPIATVNSWVTPLTVPGGTLDMWAISSVTVAGTHRRRGIARNLLEGELRAAADAGLPMAGLTVSEATIYGRYGFASAIPVARVAVDTKRAGWSGAPVPGRVLYSDQAQLADDLEQLHEASRTFRAGQVAGWRGRWERMAGLAAGDKDAAAVRGVRYLDADGVVQGAMAFRLSEIPGAFRFEMGIRSLISTTNEALRALWQFALQHDLVTKVSVDLRPIDDPLPWLVADQRGVTTEVHDHGWLRILDVVASLSARTYSAAWDGVIEVTDPLDFASGRWQVSIGTDGTASVTKTDAEPDVQCGIAELSAIYAGGVSATRLAAAGRLQGDAAVVSSLSRAFSTDPAPLLGIWY